MNPKYSHLKIRIRRETYQYALFNKEITGSSIIAELITLEHPTAVFMDKDEFSAIAIIPDSIKGMCEKIESDWICFQIVGDMPFGTVQGLISKVTTALFEEQIGTCVISTFKSDWFFIRTKYKDQARKVLQKAGWDVEV